MTNEYAVWTVSYRFDVPGEGVHSKQTERYVVAARSSEEAKQKADRFFTNIPAYRDLQLSLDQVASRVTLARSKAIKFPALIPSDAKNFQLHAHVSSDGKSLEFRVMKK
ncbi:hypothetical protein HY490_04190 [Candidatus Woesearchaeota archaeon]|nr:hypothetical protein [Candidatus Woesearchaeota archaeon]